MQNIVNFIRNPTNCFDKKGRRGSMEPYQPGLHTSDMIPGVNKIDGNSNHSEPNRAGVSGGAV